MRLRFAAGDRSSQRERRRRYQSPQSLVFLGEPGVEGGQNNPDYMFTTHDDHDEFGVASPGNYDSMVFGPGNGDSTGDFWNP